MGSVLTSSFQFPIALRSATMSLHLFSRLFLITYAFLSSLLNNSFPIIAASSTTPISSAKCRLWNFLIELFHIFFIRFTIAVVVDISFYFVVSSDFFWLSSIISYFARVLYDRSFDVLFLHRIMFCVYFWTVFLVLYQPLLWLYQLCVAKYKSENNDQ